MRVLLIVMLVTAGLPATAQVLTGKVGSGYHQYELKKPNKAFAWNGLDAYGYAYDAVSPEAAAELALRSCEALRAKLPNRQANAAPCAILNAVNKG